MNDLERDLRDLFDRKASEAVTEAPDRMPDVVHRRIRRRITRTAVAGVAAVAVLLGTLAGISRLGWVGGSDDGRPAAPGRSVQEYEVASGDTAGKSWTLVAIQKAEKWCLEFRIAEPVSRICEGSYRWEERWAIGAGYVGRTEDEFVLYGTAPSVVQAMYYDFDEGGRTEIAVGTAAELPQTGFNPFHAVLPPKPGTITIAAYPEADQTTIFRQRFAPVPPPGPPPTPELVTFSPPRGVRGAELRVTVEGLDDYSGAQVDLSFATKDGTWGQGVGSEEYRVDDNGRLEATITVPGVIAHEHQVVPGEYRMIFGSPEWVRPFEETLEVIAAAVGEKYPVSPHECLEYTSFDGRLWERESGDLTTPMPGSTIELTASDRAVYMTPEGKTVVFRVANPTAIDPETYRCPSA
jgi:hypothetical protein